MDAVISGRAGIALLIEGDRFSSFDVEDPTTLLPRRPADVRLLFGEAPDVQFFQDVNHARAAERLEHAFNCASALDLFLILLDAKLTADLRAEAAEETERLLADRAVRVYLENILYAKPLPASADLPGALAVSARKSLTRLAGVLRALKEHQPAIREARAAWDDIPAQVFGAENAKTDFQPVAVSEGLFRQLAQDAAGSRPVADLFTDAAQGPSVLAQPNHLEIMREWRQRLRMPEAFKFAPTVSGEMTAEEPPAIDSKYRMILIAAQRSKQLQRGARPRVEMDNQSHKHTRVALEEVQRGKVDFTQ